MAQIVRKLVVVKKDDIFIRENYGIIDRILDVCGFVHSLSDNDRQKAIKTYKNAQS